MKVAIVGAGFSGIGVAVRLGQEGHDYTIFEKAPDLGGVWHQNTYPGAACDVPSYLYSYSWAQRRDWSQPCSPQAEIHDYLQAVAAEHGVLGRIRFNTEITEARWDPASLNWQLQTADGTTHHADALVLACGQLSRPRFPDIAGTEDFAGHVFHSAEWDHDHDLTNRRVAVIGTGASAIQFVPPVAEQAAQLDVYQRTPPYILPRRNPRYSPLVHALIRWVPGVQAARRLGMWLFMETFILGLTKVPLIHRALWLWCTTYMKLQLKDPELRKKAWPDYPFGCKRILFSSYYLPTLARPDVELVTERIERITPDGIVTADGTHRPADTIIWGTGFHAESFVLPMRVLGADGAELQETWANGAQAHLGITVAGFPNMFLMYGPNTNLGVGSIIVMIEAQVGYIADALKLLEKARAKALDVKRDVQQASTAAIDRRLDGSVWTRCHSWYRKDGDGRVVNNWPGFMLEYIRSVEHVDPAEYELLEPAAG